MVKNIFALLLMTTFLTGCGSYTISLDKNKQETASSEKSANEVNEQRDENDSDETNKQSSSEQAQQTSTSTQPAQQTTNASSTIARTEKDHSGTYVVPTRNVNIRATPSISGTVISSGTGNEPLIYLNEKVYTTDNRIWLKVQVGSQSVGYVSSRYAEVVSGTSWDNYYRHSYSYVIVTENEANIRYNTNQNDSTAVIEKASYGDRYEYTGVTIPSEGREWYEVYTSSGNIGYISSRVSDLR